MVFRGLDQAAYQFTMRECQLAATNPTDSMLYCRINEGA
jgi:hypothetical protein